MKKKETKYNRITANCVKGILKGQQLEIKLDTVGYRTEVFANNKKLYCVKEIHIKVVPDDIVKITMVMIK